MKNSTTKNIARIILGIIILIAGILHVTTLRQEFQDLVPRSLTTDTQMKDFIVVASGIVEILLGLATIFWVKQQQKIGILLAIFLLAVYWGNIAQFINHIDAFNLDTDQKRMIRLLFQPPLIFWALWSTNALQYFKKK
ncbi:MAG TPA: MauE/DoxX family redox-associated membrane protein [Chitinophagales bacterium]|nr:MauE/DoxX family redox-associated membrane protein [Chitinophagales bacterium]